MTSVMKIQDNQYQESVLSFIKVKEKELNQLLENLKAKNNEQTEKDKESIYLKQEILKLKKDLFEAD